MHLLPRQARWRYRYVHVQRGPHTLGERVISRREALLQGAAHKSGMTEGMADGNMVLQSFRACLCCSLPGKC